MLIYFANTFLCSADLAQGRVGPVGLAINGQQANDPAGFIAADAETYFPRTRSTAVAFRVNRFLGTYAAAQRAASLLFAQLPKQGDLQLFDDAGNGLSKLPDAVVASVNAVQIDSSFGLEFQFLGGVFETEDVDIPDESDLVKAGTVNLSEGDESKAIAFDTPFASTPRGVTASLLRPSGGGSFTVDVDDSTLDETGFTVRFGAAVPGPNYKVSYIAVL